MIRVRCPVGLLFLYSYPPALCCLHVLLPVEINVFGKDRDKSREGADYIHCSRVREKAGFKTLQQIWYR